MVLVVTTVVAILVVLWISLQIMQVYSLPSLSACWQGSTIFCCCPELYFSNDKLFVKARKSVSS